MLINGHEHEHEQDRIYTTQGAADCVGITAKTLNSWLAEIGITLKRDPHHKHRNMVYRTLLQRVAHAHGRTLCDDSHSTTGEVRVDQRPFMQGWDDPEHLPAVMPSVDNAVRRAIEYVNRAAPALFPGATAIVITSLGTWDPFRLASPNLRAEWLYALSRAYTQQQRRVEHFIRLNDDSKRTQDIVQALIPALAKIGIFYHPFCNFDSDKRAEKYIGEFVIVPERGMLQLKLTDEHGAIGCSVHEFECDTHRFKTLSAKIATRRKRASALVTRYMAGDSHVFHRAIQKLESEPGNRYLFMNGLSDLTVPKGIQSDRARQLDERTKHGLTEGPALRYGAPFDIYFTHVNREEAFATNAPTYQIRDVCPLQIVSHYIKTGHYCRHDWFAKQGCDTLSGPRRKQHLQHVHDRLRDHEKYELALISEQDNMDPAVYQTFWMVKQDRGVLIETVSLNAQDKPEELNLRIDEPHVVRAFYDYSELLWNRITKWHKHRGWVQATLMNLIADISD